MNLRKPLSLSPVLFFVLLLSAPAGLLAGDFTVETTPARDNTLYEDAGGALSNGAGDHIFAGVVGPGGGETKRRALLAFDIAALLPADAVVTSASLTLHMSMSIVGETDADLHRVTSDWGESTSDAPGQEGAGTAAATGDATWLDTFFGSATWTTAGGDFDAAASATAAVAADGFYTWGPTAGITADVQGWVDTPASEFGWIVLGDEVLPPPTAKRFDSRENATVANRPRLAVSFTSESLIFLDNFESGDLTAWSASVP